MGKRGGKKVSTSDSFLCHFHSLIEHSLPVEEAGVVEAGVVVNETSVNG